MLKINSDVVEFDNLTWEDVVEFIDYNLEDYYNLYSVDNLIFDDKLLLADLEEVFGDCEVRVD